MSFINELNKKIYENNLIEKIKNYLTSSEGYDTWKEFVDNQDLGSCQTIVYDIKRNFPMVKKVFGEIDIEEPYIDEDGEEQYKMTHHWVEINNKIYDFAKGSLKGYISFYDKYDPEVEDESIYHYISGE